MSLSRIALATATVLFATTTVAAEEYWVYLGPYTRGKDGSKGIYRSKFDTETGKLSEPELAAEVGSPSFLAIHPTNKFLYAVGESSGKDGGGVFAFALDAKTGKLTPLNDKTSGGAGPCHISISPKGDYAAVANYGGGSTALFKISEDGKLSDRFGFVQHEGSSVNEKRQQGPHAHCCKFFTVKDELFVATVDLGLDKVKGFKIDPEKGLVAETDISLPPGSGPRHMSIAGDETAYVCGELDSTVNVVQGGKVVQSLSTLPKPTPGNSTAECILSPNGKFVYVSNRGHNSIAVFKVLDDGKLEAVGHITGDIKIPRNFNIDPTGQWMLIASQDGGKVGVWKLDPKTGLGKETGTTIAIDRCVCVKFVPVAK